MSQSDNYYSDLQKNSRDLKIWLLSYGIGVPALLLTNEELTVAVKDAGLAATITIAFLLGAGLQIFEAWLDKWSSHIQYAASLYDEYEGTEQDGEEVYVGERPSEKLVSISDRWNDGLSYRLMIDIGSIGSFLIATGLLFAALLK